MKINGKLGFIFQANGEVLMIDEATRPNDPKTVIHGTYTQNGDQVEIRFTNCIYVGTITNGVLSGTARFTVGNQRSWNFQLRFLPPQAPAQNG